MAELLLEAVGDGLSALVIVAAATGKVVAVGCAGLACSAHVAVPARQISSAILPTSRRSIYILNMPSTRFLIASHYRHIETLIAMIST